MDGGTHAAEEQITTGATMADALRLDGNAAAGLLREIFAVDLTTARAMCAHCGAMQAMGALLVYAHGMGTVMRCPRCDGVVMRIARTRTQMWLDPAGARHLIIAAAVLPA
jgi:ribosomal protein S27AE